MMIRRNRKNPPPAEMIPHNKINPKNTPKNKKQIYIKELFKNPIKRGQGWPMKVVANYPIVGGSFPAIFIECFFTSVC